MTRKERWTVGPGRHLYFDGQPVFHIDRGTPDVQTVPPVVLDGSAHLVADLFNRSGVTLDSIYEGHMGRPRKPRRTNERGMREDDDDENGEEPWIDAEYNEAPFLAQHWYSGQGDPLYALASAGFPQPESTVEWALRNARESQGQHYEHMEQKYGKKGLQKLLAIDPESSQARKLPDEKREDLEACDEIDRLVMALEEALQSGERISKDEGWGAHGKTR